MQSDHKSILMGTNSESYDNLDVSESILKKVLLLTYHRTAYNIMY